RQRVAGYQGRIEGCRAAVGRGGSVLDLGIAELAGRPGDDRASGRDRTGRDRADDWRRCVRDGPSPSSLPATLQPLRILRPHVDGLRTAESRLKGQWKAQSEGITRGYIPYP